jgi:competence protein ComEA
MAQVSMAAGQVTAAPAAQQQGKTNINTADASQLAALPGIGPKVAEDIIKHREANGPFKTTEDLKQVKGIGDKKYDAIKDLISVK